MTTGGFSRQGVLSLAIKEKSQLYGAYMPFLKGGGLFVPHEHVGEGGVVQRIVERNDRPAGDAEHVPHALRCQGLDDHRCSGSLHGLSSSQKNQASGADFASIQGIMDRSSLPTASMGWAFSVCIHFFSRGRPH